MAITLDNFTVSNNGSTNTANFTHIVGGSDRLLVIAIACADSIIANAVVTAVSYNSVPATFIRQDQLASAGADQSNELWYLTAPASGANTVSVTTTGSISRLTVTAISLAGVDQTNSLDSNNGATGTSVTPLVNVTTVAHNSMLVDVGGSETAATAVTPGSDQTELVDQNLTDLRLFVSIKPRLSPGSNTMSWTAANDNWVLSAAAFKPASNATDFRNKLRPAIFKPGNAR